MKFIKQFSLYTLVGFFGAGINFFLLPYLSHFINPTEYGQLSLIITYVGILSPAVSLVAYGIINVEYYRLKDKNEFASFFSSIQLIPVVPAIICLAVSFIFQRQLTVFFELEPEKSYWIPLSTVIAFSSIYVETLLAFNITQQKAVHYTLFYGAKIIVEVGLTVFFVTIMDLSWEGRLISLVVTNCVFLAVAFFYFSRQKLITKKVKWGYIIAGVSFGLPLILHTVGKFVINQSDRIFIAKMVDLEEAGIYNIGYQVGMVLLLLVTAAGNFFAPFLYERLENFSQENRLQIVKYSYAITGILFLALCVLSGFSPFFFSFLVDGRYKGGSAYVFWVGLGYFFWGIYTLFAAFVFYTKKTRFLGYLAIVNVVLNLLLNYFLIGWYGGLGAAYATTISYFVVAFIVGWKVLKTYRLPWLYFLPKSAA